MRGARRAGPRIMPDAPVIGFRARANPCGRPDRRPRTAVPANQDLVTLLRSRAPLILIESAEEGRVIEAFRHAIAQSLRPLFRWSITEGLRRLDIDDEESESPRCASWRSRADSTTCAFRPAIASKR